MIEVTIEHFGVKYTAQEYAHRINILRDGVLLGTAIGPDRWGRIIDGPRIGDDVYEAIGAALKAAGGLKR